MKYVMVFAAWIAVWGFAWRYIAKRFKAKGRGAAVSHFAGLSIGFLAGTFTLVTLIAILDPQATAKGDSVAEIPTKPPAAAEAATPVAEEKPPVEAPSEADKAGTKPAKTLKLSAEELLEKLPRLKQDSAPLADGTPRRMVQIGNLAHLELIGNASNVSRYSIMFGLPKDDKAEVITTGTLVVRVLMNTFPKWNGQGDNPMTWMGNATQQLSKNIERNKDEPAPVVKVRDGKRITYKAIPVLGLFLMSVEPA